MPRRSVPTALALSLAAALTLSFSAAEPAHAAESWDVANWSLTDSGARILNLGHVDIASLVEDDKLLTQIKDTTIDGVRNATDGSASWHNPQDTVFQILPQAAVEVPDDTRYAFLGAAGSTVWLAPETQDPAILWPGWSTEHIPAGTIAGGVEWRLVDADGPGEFFLFTSDGTLSGRQNVHFNTRDGVDARDALTIPANSHVHGNWAFTAAGTYCLAFERSTVLMSGNEVTSAFTIAVAVGDVDVKKVDPSACFAAPSEEPTEADTTPIAVGDLTESNRGDVEVLGGAENMTAGQLVTVSVAADRAGAWVSAWLDDTAWLGWAQIDAAGSIRVRLPADASAGAHALVVADREGALIGWDSLTVAGTTPPDDDDDDDQGGEDPGVDPGDEDPGDDPAPGHEAVWDVANGTVNKAGATVLNNGHVDIAARVVGGTLETRVKDTTESSDAVWRDPAQTVLQLLPESRAVVPSGSQWSFLGAAGSSFYQVTQTAQPGLLWPGWSTESIALDATQGGVAWTLTDISGPGEFALYETGSFGQPTVLFSSRDGITAADSFTIPKLTHAHGSWAFSAQGNYCLAFDRSTTLTTGAIASDSFVLAIAVGRADVMQVDPATCFQQASEEPAADTTPIADEELTEATRGGVTVLDSARGVHPGQLVSVKVPHSDTGDYISAWLHSTPTWLGWERVDGEKIASFRLPTSVAPGQHRIVVKAQDGALIGWSTIEVAAATAPSRPSEPAPVDNTPPAMNVAATQCVAGATILSAGHVDYASMIVNGQLQSLIGDDTSGTKVYREPSGTILWLKPSSAVTLPSGYGAVGTSGTQVWQVPQTQNMNLIWLGWNTESLNAGNTRSAVTWEINGVSGPGTMRVYLSGAFGGVQQMVFNNGGSYQIPQGVHAHANWAFSAEGIYRVTMTQSVTLANGQTSSDTETMTIVVGNVDPATAATTGSGCMAVSNAVVLTDDEALLKAADQAEAATPRATDAEAAAGSTASRGDAAPETAAPSATGVTVLAEGDMVPMLLAILGVLLLAGAAGTGVLWLRNQRREGVA